MSLNRYAPKRDANEPTIRKRFAHHGWHTEQMSGTGMPDLLAFNLRTNLHSIRLVDVKMQKGGFKPAQVKKWTALRAKGIPVYVVRTDADVDALVAGNLQPWEPPENTVSVQIIPKRQRRPRKVEFNEAMDALRPERRGYIPPRSTPVDAAKEAEETFAPPIHFEHCHVYAGSWCTCGASAKVGVP